MAIGCEAKGRTGLAAVAVLCAAVLVLPACAGKKAAAVKPSAPGAGTETTRPTRPAAAGPASTAAPETRTTPPAAVGSASAPAASLAPRPPAPAPLVGHVTRIDLQEYVTWKQLRAQDYTPDAAAVKRVADGAAGVEVLAIVGTWCGDSKREVPRFFKIADQAGFPMEKVTLVAVDRSKKDAGGLTEKHAITRVPTFVFLRAGQEIGRVTERPKTTLENDIADILSR